MSRFPLSLEETGKNIYLRSANSKIPKSISVLEFFFDQLKTITIQRPDFQPGSKICTSQTFLPVCHHCTLNKNLIECKLPEPSIFVAFWPL